MTIDRVCITELYPNNRSPIVITISKIMNDSGSSPALLRCYFPMASIRLLVGSIGRCASEDDYLTFNQMLKMSSPLRCLHTPEDFLLLVVPLSLLFPVTVVPHTASERFQGLINSPFGTHGRLDEPNLGSVRSAPGTVFSPIAS